VNWTFIRRYLVLLLFALWWGGFTFYSVVVVHTGHKILKSRVRQGFITQKVTLQLNALGVVTLGGLAWELALARRRSGWKLATSSWVIMAVSLGVLYWLHGRMDEMLDLQARTITNDAGFNSLHAVYLTISTVQWIMMMYFGGWLLWAWSWPGSETKPIEL
jgi:hypothetical protein